jgi:hypothetical protein
VLAQRGTPISGRPTEPGLRSHSPEKIEAALMTTIRAPLSVTTYPASAAVNG